MLAQTPIWTGPNNTDLADAFELHLPLARQDSAYRLGGVDTAWLNVLRDRAARLKEKDLIALTDDMLALLAKPTALADFRSQFEQAYEKALRMAYPLTQTLMDEHRLHSGISRDYTLLQFDPGQVRAIEDDAVTDLSMKTFAQEMLGKLTAKTKSPRHEVYRSVFDIYSEALVCRLLRERAKGRLRITKIAETDQAGPDFECELDTEINGQPRTLSFYVEVKSLDIVDAPQRLPEILDDGMDVQIELDRQIAGGRRIATAEGELAPHRRYGGGGATIRGRRGSSSRISSRRPQATSRTLNSSEVQRSRWLTCSGCLYPGRDWARSRPTISRPTRVVRALAVPFGTSRSERWVHPFIGLPTSRDRVRSTARFDAKAF